jgi:hypothetical protein
MISIPFFLEILDTKNLTKAVKELKHFYSLIVFSFFTTIIYIGFMFFTLYNIKNLGVFAFIFIFLITLFQTYKMVNECKKYYFKSKEIFDNNYIFYFYLNKLNLFNAKTFDNNLFIKNEFIRINKAKVIDNILLNNNIYNKYNIEMHIKITNLIVDNINYYNYKEVLFFLDKKSEIHLYLFHFTASYDIWLFWEKLGERKEDLLSKKIKSF